MSVLDRAIVKAYARQRNSAQSGSSERVSVRAANASQPDAVGEAALAATEKVATLLESEVNGVSPAEWESLTSSFATPPAPNAVREARRDSIPKPIDADPSAEADQGLVFEAAVAVVSRINEPVVPEPVVVVHQEAPSFAVDAQPSPTLAIAGTPTSVASRATPASPLSHESTVYQTAQRVAELAWQWPEICEQLDQFTGDGFRQLAKHLQFAAAQGHKVLAFVGATPNTGRTSVVLTLTRILALEGRTNALLIDADRRHPELASLTKLPASTGLCEVLHGQAALAEAGVRRSPGQISLLPLRTPVSDAEWSKLVGPLRTLVKRARETYDLILVDAGVFGPETKLADCWLRDAADAVITISRQLTGSKTTHDVLNWKQIGIESLGVIETFS